MTTREGLGTRRSSQPTIVQALDLATKGVLIALLVLVVVDPTYGNLEGKAPVARALAYPLLAFALPAVWWIARWERARFPWTADLLITLGCFSDILGNRLDLYDSIVWFDDWMHVMNTGLLSAAAVLLTTRSTAGLGATLERAIVVGMTISLGWELFEYVSFMTHSPERPMAYADTLGDLVLGWVGACLAGVIVHRCRRRAREPVH
jgi:hypothetical protein